MTKKCSVLIVDDDGAILETLSDVLEAKGYSVAVAQNGFLAIDRVKETDFDLALLDIVMPEMNGVQTLREMRRISPEIKAIIMTGYAVDNLIREAIAEGAVQALNKPLDLGELIQLIESLTG